MAYVIYQSADKFAVSAKLTMNIFVINLEKDTGRKAFMEKQLQSLGLSYEVIPATNGYALSDAEVQKIYDPKGAFATHGHHLSKTQIACADSHRRIYEIIKARKLPWALILEDDVQLDKRIITVAHDEFVRNSNAQWLQIDYLPFNMSFLSSWWQATKVRVARQPLFGIYALLKLPFLLTWGIYEYLREHWAKNRTPTAALFPRPLYLASAYIITAAGIEKILPLCTPIRYAADQVQNKARVQSGLRLRGIIPLLAKQDRTQFTSNLLYDNQ
jgi:GR25 family glycosyltransferase involved in LPS biosynthesis